MTARNDIRAAVTLKSRLEARPYKELSAIVAAGFQPAIVAFRVGMSLEACFLFGHGHEAAVSNQTLSHELCRGPVTCR